MSLQNILPQVLEIIMVFLMIIVMQIWDKPSFSFSVSSVYLGVLLWMPFLPVPFILLNHDHWLRASWSQGHLQEPLCFSMVFILVQLWSNDRMPFEFRSGRLFLPVTSLHFKLLLEMSVKKKCPHQGHLEPLQPVISKRLGILNC